MLMLSRAKNFLSTDSYRSPHKVLRHHVIHGG